jgi:hypothetical protein
MSYIQGAKKPAIGLMIGTAIGIRYQATTLWLLAMVAAATTISLSAQTATQSDDVIESKTVQTSASLRTPEKILQKWPERAHSIARVMIEKYGQPNRISVEALVWYNNAPWEKSVVYRKARPHSLFKPDKNFLEQTIFYQVPDDKINALRRFDQGIAVNEARDELSCRSESEDANFLALNLADEIITNKRGIKDARDFYRQTQRLSQSGKTSPYMHRFLFELINDISSRPK